MVTRMRNEWTQVGSHNTPVGGAVNTFSHTSISCNPIGHPGQVLSQKWIPLHLAQFLDLCKRLQGRPKTNSSLGTRCSKVNQQDQDCEIVSHLDIQRTVTQNSFETSISKEGWIQIWYKSSSRLHPLPIVSKITFLNQNHNLRGCHLSNWHAL